MSATEELRAATLASSQVTSWDFSWPANPDGSYSLAPIQGEAAPFLQPPADDAAALRRAAYWTAIAARALSDRSLGVTSGAYVARATAAMSSFATEGRSTILRDAAQAIRSEIPTTAAPDAATAQRRSIALLAAATLDGQAAPTALQRGTEQDDSFLATVRRQYDAAVARIQQILRGAAIAGGIVSAAVVAGIAWWLFSRKRRR